MDFAVRRMEGGVQMFGTDWLYPILLSIGAIVVCTGMELLTMAVCNKMARTPVYAGPGLKGERRQKAA